MAEAVRRNDALAFFMAARHAVQLQLGAQWNLRPEALTLGEIRERDPHLAEALEPLFTQADEVIYSGRAGSNLDLAHGNGGCANCFNPKPPDHELFSFRVARSSPLLLFLVPFLLHADTELDAANRAYTYGNYDESAKLFQQIIATRGYSAPLCFDLANAEAKAGHTGAAILNYERARYLAPADRDIDHNLQLARKQAGLEPNSYRWWQIALRSIDWTVWLAIIAACLLLIFLAIVGTAYASAIAADTKIPVRLLQKYFPGDSFCRHSALPPDGLRRAFHRRLQQPHRRRHRRAQGGHPAPLALRQRGQHRHHSRGRTRHR